MKKMNEESPVYGNQINNLWKLVTVDNQYIVVINKSNKSIFLRFKSINLIFEQELWNDEKKQPMENIANDGEEILLKFCRVTLFACFEHRNLNKVVRRSLLIMIKI